MARYNPQKMALMRKRNEIIISLYKEGMRPADISFIFKIKTSQVAEIIK